MGWASTAILSATIFGIVSIFDSHLLAKRMPSLRAFLMPVGILYLIYSGIMFALFPLPEDTSTFIVLLAIASNILRNISLLIMLRTMIKEEVSQVVPIVYTYPIFVAVMAIPLLGESLYYLEWLAIVMVVIGAVVVPFRRSSSGSIVWRGKPLLLLLGSSLLMAISDIANKYVLAYISSWNLYWISSFCMASIFIIVSIHPSTFQQLGNMKRRNSALIILTINESLALAAILLMLSALERGPVSLVSTIGSSRPVFVFAFAFILSRISPKFLEWHADMGMLIFRLIAIALIVGGITIIYLI